MTPAQAYITQNLVVCINRELDTFHRDFFRAGITDADRFNAIRIIALHLEAAASSLREIGNEMEFARDTRSGK